MKKQTKAPEKAKKEQKVKTLANNPLGYFYRVTQHLTTFSEHPRDKDGGLLYETEFKGNDLIRIRELATEFYQTQLLEGPPPFVLPYECPELFVPGKHASHSLTLEIITDEEESEVYTIVGEDELTCREGRQFEQSLLKEIGIPFTKEVMRLNEIIYAVSRRQLKKLPKRR